MGHDQMKLQNAFDSGSPASFMSRDDILKRSIDSAAMLPYWDMIDTVMKGIEGMRLAAETYLPKFPSEKTENYNFRLKSTKMTNIFRDIVENLSSKPFEDEIKLITKEKEKLPETIEEFIENVDGSGNNITVFASSTMFNGIAAALDWIFVDYPSFTKEAAPKTIAEKKKAGVRPFWSHVLARNVLEVRSEIINSSETLTYMRILEPGKPNYVRIFERSKEGVVTWMLYEEDVKAKKVDEAYVLVENGIISIGVIPLVRFQTGRRDGRSFKYFPALSDAADLQIELYQQESGLKFAKIMAAYPMLAGNGVTPEKDATGKPVGLQIGPGQVLYAGMDANGNVGSWQFIEPSATSLKFLADDIKETQQQLRELGKQPLTAQSGNLTTISSAVAAGKARSAVAAWALNLKDTLENALVLTCMFENINAETYDPQVNVYTEFDDVIDEGKDIEALNQARERGDLSQETYWKEYKRRKILSTEFDADEERKLLLDETNIDDDESEPPPPSPVDPLNPGNLPPNPEPLPGNNAA